MRRVMSLLLTAVLWFAGQSAIAQGMGMGAPNFAGIDSDSNGELSADEIAALPFVQGGQQSAEQVLTRWDTDSSGTVSEEEFNSRAMGMGMGMGMGG